MKVNITYPNELTYTLSRLKLSWLLPAKKKVEVSKADLWSLDSSLGFVILECLKAYREKVRSFGIVDNEDLPEEFQVPSEKRKSRMTAKFASELTPVDDQRVEGGWKWAIDEMIWAFNASVDDTWDDQFYNFKSGETLTPDHDGIGIPVKFDKEGFDKARARILNGRRLFAKYFDSLWY